LNNLSLTSDEPDGEIVFVLPPTTDSGPELQVTFLVTGGELPCHFVFETPDGTGEADFMCLTVGGRGTVTYRLNNIQQFQWVVPVAYTFEDLSPFHFLGRVDEDTFPSDYIEEMEIANAVPRGSVGRIASFIRDLDSNSK
jgi:hypothetical protein